MIVFIQAETLHTLIIFDTKKNKLFDIFAAAFVSSYVSFRQKIITPVGQIKDLLIIKIVLPFLH